MKELLSIYPKENTATGWPLHPGKRKSPTQVHVLIRDSMLQWGRLKMPDVDYWYYTIFALPGQMKFIVSHTTDRSLQIFQVGKRTLDTNNEIPFSAAISVCKFSAGFTAALGSGDHRQRNRAVQGYTGSCFITLNRFKDKRQAGKVLLKWTVSPSGQQLWDEQIQSLKIMAWQSAATSEVGWPSESDLWWTNIFFSALICLHTKH